MIYFTSDTHFGDDRLNLFHRDLQFKTSAEVDEAIINNWNSVVREDDTVFHLGDVAMSEADFVRCVSRLNGKKFLIEGNYDSRISRELKEKFFLNVSSEGKLSLEGIYLNHYPVNAKEDVFNLVGHIHSLWKVQRNSINVSTEAWSYFPVSLDKIKFTIEAIKKYYDQNVFAGELVANRNDKV